MTDQTPKPCLPGCRCKCGDLLNNGTHHAAILGARAFDPESHAPGCPNAPAEPPTRIECAHGHLRRKCYTCDLEEERADLRAEIAALRERVEVEEELHLKTLQRAEKAEAEVERLRGLEADYHRIVGELIPIAQPASGRPDDQLEPPWEVVARLRDEVERLRDLIAADIAAYDTVISKLRAEVERLTKENAALRGDIRDIEHYHACNRGGPEALWCVCGYCSARRGKGGEND